ncbi:bifunctional diaminohydroxyphosphoribosylaminopyrimidine deaminase/5-amino-6-(5-phosphoribosylamino)uracil reductase RibD [Candidatus Micrarchaeota archaeon]|nr:bifunctional diaminohydroxyphosphoribosylaminopyrimidine deaminase/5-amino-6-(5-phosphoribosylamino)uracil reductase RibD [Candidatus Micrarchaeota archaeon]
MRRALGLAQRASLRKTAPNPRVACILVKNNRVVAKAAHQRFGGPHAEALALMHAGIRARGATAYVTMEPCHHADKKTPPCAQALISAGIRRVVVAALDQNPKVNGAGIRSMKKAGIAVHVGVLKTNAEHLSRLFFHWIKTGRPWVTLKMAVSLDGKITVSNRWLSNPKALRNVQRLRTEHDAILVGKSTILADNPRLSVRKNGRALPKNEQPLRIIMDSRLELDPRRFQVFQNGPVLMICTNKAPRGKKDAYLKAGIDVWTGPAMGNGHVRLDALLAELGRRGIRSVLVEGGSQVATEFLESECINEAYFVVAPMLAGPEGVSLYRGREIRFIGATVQAVGDDAVFHVVFKK